MRVLLTNDDGIRAQGLEALRRALLELDEIELAVVAPDSNRSATARSITTRRPLTVRGVTFDDGTTGHETDGTPVDCVRLASLGLIEGFTPELVISGINHGANLGDDVTYSGTVAAALEAVMLGLPGIAVSQVSEQSQSHQGAEPTPEAQAQAPPRHEELRFDFRAGARFAAAVVRRLTEARLAEGTLLNINVPACEPQGVAVVPLGKRFYDDRLVVVDEGSDGRRYEIYGEAGMLQAAEGEEVADTDLTVLVRGLIAVTPMHFDLTDVAGMDALARADLSALLVPAAGEVGER